MEIPRSILEGDMYKQLSQPHREVLLEIIRLAKPKERRVLWKGELYTYGPGQICVSLGHFVRNFDSIGTRTVVRTALKKLRMWGFSTYEPAYGQTLITIRDWDKYHQEIS